MASPIDASTEHYYNKIFSLGLSSIKILKSAAKEKRCILEKMSIRFTKIGYEKLQKDYKDLISDRVLAVEDLQKARAMGDLSENGYYKAARMKLSTIDRDLRRMVQLLEKGVILEKDAIDVIGIGCAIVLFDGKDEIAYTIVGDTEADPINKKISLLSPLGKAVFGKKAGDKVLVETPSGKKTYTIQQIR